MKKSILLFVIAILLFAWNVDVDATIIVEDGTETGHMNIALDGVANFYDSETGTNTGLSAMIVSQPLHGTVMFNPATGDFSYTPTDPGYVGIDSFTYSLTDGQIAEPPVGTVSLALTNELPVAEDVYVSGLMNAPIQGNVVFYDIPDIFANGEVDPLSVLITSAPQHGFIAFDLDTGEFVYTPTDPGYVGLDNFTYSVSDGQQGAAPAMGMVTIDVLVPEPATLSLLALGGLLLRKRK